MSSIHQMFKIGVSLRSRRRHSPGALYYRNPQDSQRHRHDCSQELQASGRPRRHLQVKRGRGAVLRSRRRSSSSSTITTRTGPSSPTRRGFDSARRPGATGGPAKDRIPWLQLTGTPASGLLGMLLIPPLLVLQWHGAKLSLSRTTRRTSSSRRRKHPSRRRTSRRCTLWASHFELEQTLRARQGRQQGWCSSCWFVSQHDDPTMAALSGDIRRRHGQCNRAAHVARTRRPLARCE